MKKLLPYILILIVLAGFFSPVFKIHAADVPGLCSDMRDGSTIAADVTDTQCKTHGSFAQWVENVSTGGTPPSATPTTTYTLLAPLPCDRATSGTACVDGKLTNFDPTGDNKIGVYLNIMLRIFIGICAVLAVIMIVMGGLEYMTTELISEKADGKNKIKNAIFGLVLALGAYTLLYQINPNLLNTDLSSLKTAEVKIQFTEGEEKTLPADASKAICGQTDTVNGQTVTSCDDKNITSINFMGSSVQVNKAMVSDLQAINTAWQNSTDPKVKAYRVSSLGGYNPRTATNSTKPSAHAFGVALDINPGQNPYSNNPSNCVTDMPLAFVKLFTDRGFGWGGYWNSKKDTMHFSKSSNEAGYTSGTCSGLK